MYSIDKSPHPDRPMRFFSGILITGFLLLVGKLWHLQIISSETYEDFQKVQSVRRVHQPASRGRVFDRNGNLLADNRPNYGIVLFLDDLRPLFQKNFRDLRNQHDRLHAERIDLERFSRYSVVSNLCASVTSLIGRFEKLERSRFERHYDQKRYIPFPVARDLTHEEMAKFLAKGSGFIPGVALEIQPIRHYPNASLAAHLLGYVRKVEPEKSRERSFGYYQPDYAGKKGIEQIYDKTLRGKAGESFILINHLMFRHEEHIVNPPEAGEDLFLTLDLDIQKIAETALAESKSGRRTMGAVIVMNVKNGDVLAMASSPSYDPNEFMKRISSSRWKELNDPILRPLINRAAYGAYAPGSIFKIIVALAFLQEGGVNPQTLFYSPGFTQLGRRLIRDTAGAGDFDFFRALAKSSNPYFIHHGMEVGVEAILDWGNQFFLGKKTGLLPNQERSGNFPKIKEVRKQWHAGETANLCIGQGAIAVTPLQMAVMASAIANGGTVFKPRIAAWRQKQDSSFKEKHGNNPHKSMYPASQIRGKLNASDEVLQILHKAMCLKIENPDETNWASNDYEGNEGYFIGGKTGTAETNKRIHGQRIKDTWFVSFAPIHDPQYAVVVLVVAGDSGRSSCVPIARKIYGVLQNLPRRLN